MIKKPHPLFFGDVVLLIEIIQISPYDIFSYLDGQC